MRLRLDLCEVGQVGGVGVAAVGVGDAALVGDVGADLLGEELGLALGERFVVGAARVAVARRSRYRLRCTTKTTSTPIATAIRLAGP